MEVVEAADPSRREWQEGYIARRDQGRFSIPPYINKTSSHIQFIYGWARRDLEEDRGPW